jgi:hypothetical protein
VEENTMPEKFLGVQMTREYTWGYICEHCGKSVELQNKLSAQYGATARKSSMSGTTFSLTNEGKNTYLAQGRTQFPHALELALADWNNGKYPTDVVDKYSVCTHCRKHQHWSKEIQEFTTGTGTILGGIFAGLFGGGLFALIPTIIVSLIVKNNPKVIFLVLFIVWGLLFLISIAGSISNRSTLKREKKELEVKEKQFPQFKAWGNISEEIFGLKR